MKLLVFAHTPPPLHGQSAMVALLLEQLASRPDFEVHHVNAQLSDDAADIGRARPAKLGRLLRACVAAWRIRRRHGPMSFYYVPAPAKRTALYRDFVVLLLCRPFFRGLILHWHAVGLGEWLQHRATAPDRWLAQRLLGRAEVALVLSAELAADAAVLRPRHLAIVPNAVPDPGPPARSPRPPVQPCRVLYVGLCTAAKGVADAIAAVQAANGRVGGAAFRLTLAGPFASSAEEAHLRDRAADAGPGIVTFAGPVGADAKDALFAAADLFCFPTRYPHEGQPLVILEALARDLPVVASRWRAIPAMLPATGAWQVTPANVPELTDALLAARTSPPPAGALRAQYLTHFTPAHHATALVAALAPLRR